MVFGTAFGWVVAGWLAASTSASAGQLVVVNRLWGAGAVRWVDDAGSTLLEGFDPPEEVFATGVSADERYGFCWHRPDGKSRRLSLYDLRERRWIRTIIPGFGGDLRFSAGDTLVHDWGCGTNCSGFAVYRASDGRRILSLTPSGLSLPPSVRYAITYSTVFASTEPVSLYDLTTGAQVAEVAVPSGALADSVRWDEAGRAATVSLVDRDGRPASALTVALPK